LFDGDWSDATGALSAIEPDFYEFDDDEKCFELMSILKDGSWRISKFFFGI